MQAGSVPSSLDTHPFKDHHSKYIELCRALNLDEDTQQFAWNLLARLTLKPQNEEERYFAYMAACALYVAGKKDEGSQDLLGNCVSLSQLLNSTQIRLVDFFEPLKAFIANLQLGARYEEQLQNLEKKFCVVCFLFRKYEKEFSRLFKLAGDADESKEALLYSLGWLLFLVAKGKILAQPPDLINAFHLLLCCINLLIVTAPANLKVDNMLRDVSTSSHSSSPTSSPDSGGQNSQEPSRVNGTSPAALSDTADGGSQARLPALNANTLQILCEQTGANVAEVKHIQEKIFEPFILQLQESGVLCLQALIPNSQEVYPEEDDVVSLKRSNQALT
jgi:hypothetical protein